MFAIFVAILLGDKQISLLFLRNNKQNNIKNVELVLKYLILLETCRLCKSGSHLV